MESKKKKSSRYMHSILLLHFDMVQQDLKINLLFGMSQIAS
uniref:Uncharacterized protein n=1 Tax=Rhizophora mucronata TaxID=61149 RepID=A0A2P2QEM8_RHIMU